MATRIFGFPSAHRLREEGFKNLRVEYWNLPVERLYEEVIKRREGYITKGGALLVYTGKHTARAANDKYIVKREENTHIFYNNYNRPIAEGTFDRLLGKMLSYAEGKDVFIQDCYVGSDRKYRMPIRIITEHAWQSIFARNMFIKPEPREYIEHIPEFTVICFPGFKANPEEDGTSSDTFIIVNFERKMAIIGNTGYGGEIKKTVFTVMNYLLPFKNVVPMHCSANVGRKGDTAVFFGLSGTGKTTLSADPDRQLIGDDEHGWSDDGVFNFEDGCYAKVIKISKEHEPFIYRCTQMFGTVLENVVFDENTRLIDLDSDRVTENTRASYPLDFIENSKADRLGGHPENIIFLTCDAYGVMPPVAKLNVEQMMYHFISGYTSKVGGTEIGLGKKPIPTFSACFGAPFMVHHPYKYAEMLKERVEKHKTKVWLVNTGWIGGGYGVGERISIKYTREILNSILNGELDSVDFTEDPVFGFKIPLQCNNIPSEILQPWSSWADRESYNDNYKKLAAHFVENFKKFEKQSPEYIKKGGPKL